MNLGDVDLDGDLDAVVMGSAGAAYLMLNDGTGTFSIGQELLIPGSIGWEGKFGDFDSDGDLDLYMSSDAAFRNLHHQF
ncbi:MAG: VCBS repeat-containing protein [Planctomycetaceae bacterium]